MTRTVVPIAVIFTLFAASTVAQETGPVSPQPPASFELTIGEEQLQPLVQQLGDVSAAVRSLQEQVDDEAEAAKLERELRDLNAQESMADWAKWMFWATGAGVFLGLLSLAAIIVTLLYTRRAAISGEEMASDARSIGRAQVRAYLHCVSAEYNWAEDAILVSLHLGNAGQSPASKIRVEGTASIHVVGGFEGNPRVQSWLESEITKGRSQPIAAQGNGVASLVYFWDMNFPEDEYLNRNAQKEIFDTGNEIWFDLKIQWSDVFGSSHKMALNLNAIIARHPGDTTKERAYSGELHVIVDENTITTFRKK